MREVETVRIYPFGRGGYSEQRVIEIGVYPQKWCDIATDLPADWFLGRLRIDPLSRPGLIEIETLRIKIAGTGETLWPAAALDSHSVQVDGAAVVLPNQPRLTICSCDANVRMYVPVLRDPVQTCAFEMRIRLNAEEDFLRDAFSRCDSDGFEKERERLLLEVKTAQAERMILLADLRQLAAEQSATQLEHYTGEIAKLRKALEQEKHIREQILNSVSWKMTAPLRSFMAKMRHGSARKQRL